MRRVLLVDDPRLAPRLARLRSMLDFRWDALISPAEQLDFWKSADALPPSQPLVSIENAETLISTGEPLDLVVAASSPAALALASRIAGRRGSRLTVLPDAAQTADWIYSLYPLSEGGEPRVAGLFEHRCDPAVRAFRDTVRSESNPAARHLTCTCTLPVASLTDAETERQFLEDVDLLRWIAGDVTHLLAVPRLGPGGSVISAMVTLDGVNCPSLGWTIEAGPAFGWKLTSRAESNRDAGQTVVLIRAPDGTYSLEPHQSPASLPPRNEKLEASPGLDRRKPGFSTPGETSQTHSPTAEPNPAPELTPWNDVLRAFDDLAAVRRSRRRRRVVELQTETISERAQFKSLMSASGCGLLMATLLGAVALLAAGAAFDPRESLQRTSERAELVLYAEDFEPDSSEFLEEAGSEWPAMVRRLAHSAAPILIERTESSAIDAARRERLVSELARAGVPSPASRVEIFPMRGQLFLTLLTAAWVLLFLPLGVFLVMQALVLLTPNTDDVHSPRLAGGNPPRAQPLPVK